MMVLGRKQALIYFDKEPDIIIHPFNVDQNNWLKQHNTDWLLSQIGFEGSIDNHYPQDRLMKFLNVHKIIFPNMASLQPLHNVLLIDGSSKVHTGYLINNQQVINRGSWALCSVGRTYNNTKCFSVYKLCF